MIFKSLLTKDKEKYNMIIIWISFGFVSFMVSSSYSIDLKFWILIGLIVNNFQIDKDKKHFHLKYMKINSQTNKGGSNKGDEPIS